MVTTEEIGFSFNITGALTKTISGETIFFATESKPDIFGEDLNTMSFSAVDDGNGQVSFGITTYDLIGKGTYPIELRIAPEAYNGYVNFTEDPVNKPIYAPAGGAIKLTSVRKEEVAGSLDVSCRDPKSGKLIQIKGDFRSVR